MITARSLSADKRTGGMTYAIEYKYGWLGAQVSHQEHVSAVNLYVAIPLMRKEFIPKVHEPKPYTSSVPQPTMNQWRTEPRYTNELVQALEQQGYKNIKLRRDDHLVESALRIRA
jgi:hypothetical protein